MKSSSKWIYYWLISGVILVSCMVVIGGITRLTHSGLSIVEWKPITGIIPPLSEKDWISEFDKYKQSPEFIHKNSYFELADFKKIYFWEYLHRFTARLIGMLFIVPFIYFGMRGLLKPIRKKMYLILGFGIFQGFLGWFMVKSGLVDNPNVSHYRLAAHFIMALLLISLIYHTALSLKYGVKNIRFNTKLKGILMLLTILIFIQITYGAFVSGLKAGLFYNTFPKMGEDWLPEAVSLSLSEKGLLSLMENIAAVQFIHRLFALILLVISIFLFFYFKRAGFTPDLKKQFYKLFLLIIFQYIIGVTTLLLHVPFSLGVFHQFMAILLVLQLTKTVCFSRI